MFEVKRIPKLMILKSKRKKTNSLCCSLVHNYFLSLYLKFKVNKNKIKILILFSLFTGNYLKKNRKKIQCSVSFP